jgi:hypothetical protein
MPTFSLTLTHDQVAEAATRIHDWALTQPRIAEIWTLRSRPKDAPANADMHVAIVRRDDAPWSSGDSAAWQSAINNITGRNVAVTLAGLSPDSELTRCMWHDGAHIYVRA